MITAELEEMLSRNANEAKLHINPLGVGRKISIGLLPVNLWYRHRRTIPLIGQYLKILTILFIIILESFPQIAGGIPRDEQYEAIIASSRLYLIHRRIKIFLKFKPSSFFHWSLFLLLGVVTYTLFILWSHGLWNTSPIYHMSTFDIYVRGPGKLITNFTIFSNVNVNRRNSRLSPCLFSQSKILHQNISGETKYELVRIFQLLNVNFWQVFPAKQYYASIIVSTF